MSQVYGKRLANVQFSRKVGGLSELEYVQEVKTLHLINQILESILGCGLINTPMH